MIHFDVVDEQFRKNFNTFTDEKGKKHRFPIQANLPQRQTSGSSGYDFHLPHDVDFLPHRVVVIATDIKAIMPPDVELQIRNRSSLAIKHDLQLINNPATIDSDYANNTENGGNIMLVFINRSGITYKAKAGERIAQGVFANYLITDDDKPVRDIRSGGIGSTNG